jgi:hypothetical protein
LAHIAHAKMPGKAKNHLSIRRLRSAISNGTHVLHGIDHRSRWMRRLSDLISQHVADAGGEDYCSQAELVLIRRCAMLTLQLELMEHRWAENDGEASAKQLEVYQRVANSLHRILAGLGLQRRAKPVMTLGEILHEDAMRQQRERRAVNGEQS